MGIKKKVKKTIKRIRSYILHPVFMIRMQFSGYRDFIIGSGLKINSVKNLSIGRGTEIGKNSRFLLINSYHGGVYSPSITIGCNVSITNNFSVLSADSIIIEDNCLIASDVLITSENHGTDLENSESYAELPLVTGPVHIGKGCWLGEKVCVMPNVTLGDRCIVAAGAVVTKSFDAGSLIGGVPARVIKKYNYDTHSWEII